MIDPKKLLSRLGIFFIGLPALLTVALLPYANHLALHILIMAVSIVAANEAYNMFSAKTPLMPRLLVLLLVFSITSAASLYELFPVLFNKNFPVGEEIISYTFISAVLIVLFAEVFFSKTFENSLTKLASSVFILMYAGYLITFVSRMTTFSKDGKDVSPQLIAVFILMVCFCDSFAWLFGVLFGKSNRGFVKASPNKSVAGFLGGIIGSVIAGIAGYFAWPAIFEGSLFKIIFAGIVIAVSSIVGDLAESVMKRSCNFKDSGNIIPGRGGLLDSIDSILMSAPLYYMIISMLYGPL